METYGYTVAFSKAQLTIIVDSLDQQLDEVRKFGEEDEEIVLLGQRV